MMAPEFAKAAAQAAWEAVVVKVNTEDQPRLPAFALMKAGKLIAQTSGFQSASQLLSWMRQS